MWLKRSIKSKKTSDNYFWNWILYISNTFCLSIRLYLNIKQITVLFVPLPFTLTVCSPLFWSFSIDRSKEILHFPLNSFRNVLLTLLLNFMSIPFHQTMFIFSSKIFPWKIRLGKDTNFVTDFFVMNKWRVVFPTHICLFLSNILRMSRKSFGKNLKTRPNIRKKTRFCGRSNKVSQITCHNFTR